MLSCMLWLWIVRDKLVPPIYEKPATEMVEIVSSQNQKNTQNIKKTEKTDSIDSSTNNKSEFIEQSINLLKNEDDDDKR